MYDADNPGVCKLQRNLRRWWAFEALELTDNGGQARVHVAQAQLNWGYMTRSPKGSPELDEARLRQQAIGARLRQLFDDVVNEPVPEDFLDILRSAEPEEPAESAHAKRRAQEDEA